MTQTTQKTDLPRLGRWQAFFNAFCSRPIEHFPRQVIDDQERTIDDGTILAEIGETLDNLHADGGALDTLVDRGRESLDEVKALTEYADQKSTRLLTVVTFFMALAGLLFVGFAKDHPISLWGGAFDPWQIPPALVDLLFGIFVFSVVAGALVVFHANQSRFRYPRVSEVQVGAKPRSQIFFSEMIRVRPADWAASFTEQVNNKPVPASDLSLRYAKSYIAESYLIAAKVADKLRYLQAAQNILALSLKILLLWFFLIAGVSAFPAHAIVTDPTAKTAALTAPPAPAALATATTLVKAPEEAHVRRPSALQPANVPLLTSGSNVE